MGLCFNTNQYKCTISLFLRWVSLVSQIVFQSRIPLPQINLLSAGWDCRCATMPASNLLSHSSRGGWVVVYKSEMGCMAKIRVKVRNALLLEAGVGRAENPL